jgi:secreted Zn-dependent insulinase-like peptidase
MRTEKQYGYIVGVGFVPINCYPGIAFYVQSPHTDSMTLAEVMDEFISECSTFLNDITPDDWQALRQGLAGQLQEKDQNLRIQSQRFWAAICNKDELFIYKKQLLETLLSLSLEQVSGFIRNKLMSASQPDRIILFSQDKKLQGKIPQVKKETGQLVGKIIKANDFTKKSKRKY